jgi:DNA replication protein DnaC
MLNQATLSQLRDLRLYAMAAKFKELMEQGQAASDVPSLSFEERFALLVEAEWLARYNRRTNRLLTQAAFRLPAVIEDIAYQGRQGISRPEVLRLSSGSYLKKAQNILICGPTGVGKTYLVCALGHAACVQGTQTFYIRVADFFQHLADAQMDNRYSQFRDKLSKVPLLILDDWGLKKFTLEETHEIMELFERRYGRAATIISGQLPVSAWHDLFPDPTLADAILDRVVHNAYKYSISGESMRKTLAEKDLVTD